MTNGDSVLSEIRALTSSQEISPAAATRLQLSVLALIYERMDKQDDVITDIEKRLADIETRRLPIVERASIILWVTNNPKVALFILGLIILVSAYVPWRDVFERLLGL